jgi:hypothetical protein
MRTAALLAASAIAALLPVAAAAQASATVAVQRCEAADGRVVYSNQACPPGSRAVRRLTPAATPAPATGEATRKRAQSEAEIARALEQRRRERAAAAEPLASPASFTRLGQRQSEAIQRAADCGYLQGEIDATQRLRNILQTRRYYSYEDAEMVRQLISELSEDYRLLCGP